MKNILIVTGGTGGHVIPSIALSEHLSKKFFVQIVTDLRGSKYISKNCYNYELIDVPNLFKKFHLLPLNILKYFLNIFKSLKFIKKNKIDILISTGGYMTLPFCLAAFFLKKKIILFEPNSVLGRSNKIALKFSSKVICYDINLKKFPIKYNFKKKIIYPILKKELYEIKKKISKSRDVKKILIIGGSQGASFFDSKIADVVINLQKQNNFEIVQQIANKNSLEKIKQRYKKAEIKYKFFEFTNNSDDIYKDIDLAITRGGASTLSELSFLNIPFIVIPLPSAIDNHQFHNSNYYYQKGCCWLIEQHNFENDKILSFISQIFNNNQDYKDKILNLRNITEQNTWNKVNNRIIEIVDEN